jgi:multidrug efflux pump subunit AcrA (membrane-fusion protein)
MITISGFDLSLNFPYSQERDSVMDSHISTIPRRSIQPTEFLPPLGRMFHLGGWALVGTIVAAIALAANVRYNKIVKATAIARPVGELRVVQAPIEGTIAQILVQENQLVKAGEPIAILEHSQLETQRQQLQSNIHQTQSQLQQIDNQIKQLELQQQSERSANHRSVAVAQADLAKQEQELHDRQLISAADLREAEAQVAFARDAMQRYQSLADTGVIALIQVKEKEEAFQSAIAKRDRALAIANPHTAPITAAEQTIQQQQALGDVTVAKIAQEKTRLTSQHIALQAQIDRDRLTLQQLQQDQQKPLLRSPIGGKLHQLNLRNVGQFVPVGQTIAQVAPADAALQFKAQISAEDMGQIQRCLPAASAPPHACNAIAMRLVAYPHGEYGTLPGKIVAITPDVVTAGFYEMTIQPDRLTLTKAGQAFPIAPGMNATVEITTQQETFLGFLMRQAEGVADRK